MITIKNQTEKVIVVENQHVHIEIPIGETVEIPKEKLQGDDYLFCRFFSSHGEEITVDFEMRNDGLYKRWYLHYRNESSFPMVTKLPIGNRDTLCLKEEKVDLRVILLFKVVVLRRITAASDQEQTKEEYQFSNAKDKKRFAKLMRKLLFFLPIALICSVITVETFFHEEYDWMQKGMLSFFCFAIAFLIFRDVWYYFRGRKWKCFNHSDTD